MSDSSAATAWLSRPVSGALVIAGLVAALQIPISMIQGLIHERVATRDQALEEVTATWGGAQVILGPRLVVPFVRTGDAGEKRGFASFLPTSLAIDGDVDARALSRGLFTVPVYDGTVRIQGRFERLETDAADLGSAVLAWEDASLVVELSDPKVVGAGSALRWRGEAASLLPGTLGSAGRRGIHAAVRAASELPADFDLVLELNGSTALSFVPFAKQTSVTLSSNWPHPSFAGAWLPVERTVTDAGFSATWNVPFLGRDYAQAWTEDAEPHERIVQSGFGVELVSPIDHYRMSERSTKYAPLFLILTFGLLWVFDAIVGVRVHPIQYLFVGAATCLFYLLELSLSEHLGFLPAYLIAGGGVVGLTMMYTTAVLGAVARGATVGAAMGGLYAYLLALLSLERYALLAGSLGLFAVLALAMYTTRWVEWDRVVHGARSTA